MKRLLSKLGLALGALAMVLAGASLTAGTAAAASCYGPSGCPSRSVSVTVSVGSNGVITLTVSGSGFQISETINFTAYSHGIDVGSTRSNSGGSFSTSIVLPSGLASGQHTLVATGATNGDTASTTFVLNNPTSSAYPCASTSAYQTINGARVVDAAYVSTACLSSGIPAASGGSSTGASSTGSSSSNAATPSATPSAASSASQPLAFTGIDVTILIALAAIALTAGGMLVLSTRRRRAN